MAQAPSILPAFLAFIGVLALIPGVLWVIKRLQQGMPHSRQRLLTLAGGLPLGPRERVVIIETEGRRWMLGVTAQHIALLAELAPARVPDAAPDGIDTRPTPPSAASFSTLLERLRRPTP